MFLIIMFTVGLVGHSIPSLKPIMIYLTPFTLLLTGGITFYFSYQKRNVKLIVWGLIIYILTFSVEIIGVKTGYIFGNYNYGDVLGFKLFDVPLIIGFNWVVIMLGATGIASRIHKSTVQIALLTGTFAVLFDLMLEPVAINIGYWKWQQGFIPLQNYYAWFGIAFFASFLSRKLKLDLEDSLFIYYFLIQFTFFILLSIFMS
ncbi:MAG: carotenoid biosynthesis protein [Ignavibacteriaceae bacterium]|nr:carotenoid biosynthesis protein [Ignavibacteriaceae bacterium]